MLVEKMVLLSDKDQPFTEDDIGLLILYCDIIQLISTGRKKTEEETNALIKTTTSKVIELYLLINPLIYWLEFSLMKEDRLHLFKAIW